MGLGKQRVWQAEEMGVGEEFGVLEALSLNHDQRLLS